MKQTTTDDPEYPEQHPRRLEVKEGAKHSLVVSWIGGNEAVALPRQVFSGHFLTSRRVVVEADTDLNKTRADLIKQVNYLFANPSLPKKSKEEAVKALQELVRFLKAQEG